MHKTSASVNTAENLIISQISLFTTKLNLYYINVILNKLLKYNKRLVKVIQITLFKVTVIIGYVVKRTLKHS